MTTTTPLRILLVEDDSSIGLIIKIGMQDLQVPYQLDYAFSAEEGLELWHRQPYDLVLTDYNLRGKNGVDLVTALKQEDAGGGQRCCFTAYDTPQIRKAATAAGVTRFVSKPFFVDQFIELVAEPPADQSKRAGCISA